MKKTFLNICLLSVVGFAGILTSCRESFDYEEAYRQNPEYAYKEAFEKAFGEIDPDQSWDFTDIAHNTRADEPVTPITTQAQIDTKWTEAMAGEWYYVEDKTIRELQTILPETGLNYKRGEKFVCVAPDNDFTITPIYQGGNTNSPTIYMKIDGVAYNIWVKGKGIEKTGCDTCHGEGKYCGTCKGLGYTKSGNKYYGCTACGGKTGSGVTNVSYLNNRGSGIGTTTCHVCNGDGLPWVSSNVNYTWDKGSASNNSGAVGTTTGYREKRSKATKGIRGKSLYFKKGEIPAGSIITFEAVVGDSHFYSDQNDTGKDKNGDKINKPLILSLSSNDVSVPDGIANQAAINGVKPQVMYISCEAGSDTDINDCVFLVKGYPFVPQTITFKEDEIEIPDVKSKRYMLEDLGATTESDIDFNDLVIDVVDKTVETRKKKTQTAGGSTTTTYETIKTEKEKYAIVWALGGTKNLAVYLADNTQSSVVADPSNDLCIFVKDQYSDETISNGVTVTPNTAYKGANISHGLTASMMYNTIGQADKSIFAKNSDQTYETGPTDYIAKIVFNENTVDQKYLWKPDLNNIYVVVYDVKSGFVGRDETDSKKIITFPNNGDVPAMIAVNQTMPWNWERVNVFTDLNESTGNMLQLTDGTVKGNLADYPLE